MTPFEFYCNFLRMIVRPQALPPAPRFHQYFYDRGISPEMIAESGAIPLTQHPAKIECDAFKAAFGESRLKETGEPNKICDGILFPTQGNDKEFGTHGTARAFTYSDTQ